MSGTHKYPTISFRISPREREEIRDLREAYEDMLKAILWMLDGARYLWQGEEKSPDSGNC